MKKQQKENEQIARIIERQNIINFKKKVSNKPQKDSDQQIESANSLKSGVFSQENNQVKFSKKNTPLPELNRQRKKMFQRNVVTSDSKQVNNYLEKQVRQQDNLVLKQKNNILSSQNMKLKTKVMALQKQIVKLTKSAEQDINTKIKQPGLMPKDIKFKGSQLLSLKMTIKNLRKDLDQQKKQNQKIKCSIKFTRIGELQCQRDELMAQTTRLREMLEEQLSKRAYQKVKQQGLSGIEHKLQNLHDRNLILMRENTQLKNKAKLYEEGNTKYKQSSENQKNLSKMLFNAKKIIKQKQRQIQTLKLKTSSTEPKIQSNPSIPNQPKSLKQVPPKSTQNPKQKRIISKSAQKYRKKTSDEPTQKCQTCQTHKTTIQLLEQKIQQLSLSLKAERDSNARLVHVGQFSREEVPVPTAEEVERLERFLVFRFKAHHLGFEECQKYLINGEITEASKKEEISVMQMAENLIAQPFSVLSSRYLQVFLLKLFYPKQTQSPTPGPTSSSSNPPKLKLSQHKKLPKGQLLQNFTNFLKPYTILSQQKQQQMFIQIAELVTNYHQHILTALNRKKNGEGTIEETELVGFFAEIELERDFTEFVICQIILQSLDLEHLNYYTMFEIFYMPNQGVVEVGTQPGKKKFQVQHSQVVKEEDQEYEESKSHLDTKQKTQSNKNQEIQADEHINEQNQNSPSQHSQKNHNADQQTQNLKLQSRNKRNKSMKNVQAKLQKQKLKQQPLHTSKPATKPAIYQEQPQSHKHKHDHQHDHKHDHQHDHQHDYQQQFQQQKMDKLPEQEKANQEGDGEEKEYKPYEMEEVYEEYVQEEGR